RTDARHLLGMIPQMLTQDVARAPAVSRLAGCVALAGAAVSVALHAWIRRGVFVPVRLPASVEYVWISAAPASFVAILIVTGAAIAAMHLLVRRISGARRIDLPALSWADVEYLLPLWCFAATLLSLLNLIRPRIPALAVMSYVVVDLRWWWTALVLFW